MKTNEQHATDNTKKHANQNAAKVKNIAYTEFTKKKSIKPEVSKRINKENTTGHQNDVAYTISNSDYNPDEINGLGAKEQIPAVKEESIQERIKKGERNNIWHTTISNN